MVALLAGRGDRFLALFRMDVGPLVLARDAGGRGVAAFPVAHDLAQVCSRPSGAGGLDAGERTSSFGGNAAQRTR